MTEAQRNRLKNVVLYILKNFSGGADYIKLYKIMYFANREQLSATISKPGDSVLFLHSPGRS